MDEMPEPRHLSSILTCHADIPSAPTLMTECQGRFGALVSPALDCCEEFVCATLMYGDSDLSLTSTPLVDERVPSTEAYADDLPPVSSMPPLPIHKRMVTGAQRSSVDGGVWQFMCELSSVDFEPERFESVEDDIIIRGGKVMHAAASKADRAGGVFADEPLTLL